MVNHYVPNSEKDKGIHSEWLTLGNVTSDQYFMQDRGQGHCKNNVKSGQYFKHNRGKGNLHD